jgi:hypothetical protein
VRGARSVGTRAWRKGKTTRSTLARWAEADADLVADALGQIQSSHDDQQHAADGNHANHNEDENAVLAEPAGTQKSNAEELRTRAIFLMCDLPGNEPLKRQLADHRGENSHHEQQRSIVVEQATRSSILHQRGSRRVQLRTEVTSPRGQSKGKEKEYKKTLDTYHHEGSSSAGHSTRKLIAKHERSQHHASADADEAADYSNADGSANVENTVLQGPVDIANLRETQLGKNQ